MPSPSLCQSLNDTTAYGISTENTCISTEIKAFSPLVILRRASRIPFTGRVIFQKERVDKGYPEDRQRTSRSTQDAEGNGIEQESSYNGVVTEEHGEGGLTLAGTEGRRDDKIVIWSRIRSSKIGS